MNPSNLSVVATALSKDGPLLRAFGIEPDSIHSPTGRFALEALAQLDTDSPGFTDSLDPVTTTATRELLLAAQRELLGLDLTDLALTLSQAAPASRQHFASEFWKVFAPTTEEITVDRDLAISRLRQQRRVTITRPPSEPISNAASQILFTSNALVTVGPDGARDPQVNFYDHPTALGAPKENNEICYGLRQLDDSMVVERIRGNLADGQRLTCLLSVSATHASLTGEALRFATDSILEAGPYANIEVYAVDEATTNRLIHEVFVPLSGDVPDRFDCFGVDGRYGRHYSFLKAIASLWQAVINPGILATFKFDLDQVFPQTELIATTGKSALEHLANPLWGATGVDSSGTPIELGMLAGALVNQSDIGRGLLTSDTPPPTADPELADLVLRKIVPQSASTEAEMMWAGTDPIERVHVTGGTSGIRVDAVRRYHPFTPSFMSRAEDQAYLMGTLEPSTDTTPSLRCLHGAGLFMRHDKEAMAKAASESAEVGRTVGDLERILLFSAYSRALGLRKPEILDPFTGAFISDTPVSTSLLRLLLEVVVRASENDLSAEEFLALGVHKIHEAYLFGMSDSASIDDQLRAEQEGWDAVYSCVDKLADNQTARTKAQTIIQESMVRFGQIR